MYLFSGSYFSAVGSSFWKEMWIMTPPMMPKRMAKVTGPTISFNTSHAKRPPKGSDIPDRKAQKKALHLEFVAFKIGAATAKPSGML